MISKQDGRIVGIIPSNGIASPTSTSYCHYLVSNIQYLKKKQILSALWEGSALTWDFFFFAEKEKMQKGSYWKDQACSLLLRLTTQFWRQSSS